MSLASSVLLVDDHGLVRHGLQLLLQEAMPSLRVRIADSLAAALGTLAQDGRFDLVLLDLTLGDVHGMAGLLKLRADFKAAWASYITGQMLMLDGGYSV